MGGEPGIDGGRERRGRRPLASDVLAVETDDHQVLPGAVLRHL
jgi:hypothetical protein